MYIIQEEIRDDIWRQVGEYFGNYDEAKKRLNFHRNLYAIYKYRMVKLAIEVVE